MLSFNSSLVLLKVADGVDLQAICDARFNSSLVLLKARRRRR